VYEPLAILTGSIVALALLFAEHVALWPYQERLHQVARYVIGTATIGIGVTLTAALLNVWLIAIAFWCVAGPGGALIVSLWWARGIDAARIDAATDAGMLAGQAREESGSAETRESGTGLD
jgi:hypothetical protein